MASFSVDITDIKFAAAYTGYKDITITYMPQAGVTCSFTSGSSYFGYRIPGTDPNVYRIYTLSHTNINTAASAHTGVLRIENAGDSSDYVDISLEQVAYGGSAEVFDIVTSYSNIYTLKQYTYLAYYAGCFDYTSDISGTYLEAYVDGYLSYTSSDNWVYVSTEVPYTDTGFKRVQIGCINNYEGARSGYVQFGNSSKGRINIYQNGYPGTQSGCTSPVIFQKTGGTQVIELHSPENNVNNINYFGDYSTVFSNISLSKSQSGYTTSVEATVGNNTGVLEKKGVLGFWRSSNHTFYGFSVIEQAGDVLSVVPSELMFSSNGGSSSIAVSYRGDTYTVDGYEIYQWCDVSVSDVSVGHLRGTVTCYPNVTMSQRTGNIYISDSYGSIALPITQEAHTETLSASPSSISFTSGGGVRTMDVTFAAPLSTNVDNMPSWLSQSYVLVDTSLRRYTVDAAANFTSSSRSFDWVFRDANMEITVPVTQAAGVEPVALSVSPSVIDFDISGGTESVTVTGGVGNIVANTGSFPSWLSISSVGGGVYDITATEYTGTTSRSFGIWFTDETPSTVTVDVYQTASNVTVSPGSLEFTNTGLYQDVLPSQVQYYADVTVTGAIGQIFVSSISSWLSYTVTGNVFRIEAFPNSGDNERYGSIVFTDGITSAEVNVNQHRGQTDFMSVTPSDVSFNSTGGSSSFYIWNNENYTYGSPMVIRKSSWIDVYLGESNSYIVVGENTGSQRDGYVCFEDDVALYTTVMTVHQEGANSYRSIWKGILNHPDSIMVDDDSLSYGIFDSDDNILFEGVYIKGTEGINIPRLVDSYIDSGEYDDYTNGYSFQRLKGDLSCVLSYDGRDHQYSFWNDWSWDRIAYNNTISLNDPINFKGCQNMEIPFCVFCNDSSQFSIDIVSTSGVTSTISLGNPSNDFSICISDYNNISKVTYKKDSTELFSYDMSYCGSGYFVYRNRYGGWDSFLVEGNTVKKEGYTREKYTNKMNGYAPRVSVDKTDIRMTYEASTGWLSDDEAQRLVYHLLSSPRVHFYDFNMEEWVTVNITNTEAEYKKFRNGKRMVSYTISFERAVIQEVQR